MDIKLNPPIVDNKTIAQNDPRGLSIPFLMNKSVGWADFNAVKLIVKTIQSNTELLTLTCLKDSLTFSEGKYWGFFTNGEFHKLQIGQYYKAQLAYIDLNGEVGFYSTVTTFKFTSIPTISIQGLETSITNVHVYNYTGVYENESDPSEKVYSYCFELYDNSNNLIITSGNKLHNSSLDTNTTNSIDTWTTRYSLKENKTYLLVYKIKTINGLECTSPTYKIVDNQTVPSSLFQYCDFTAVNINDSACIELSLQPKSNIKNYKFISGQFVLLRSSNEDNFDSWHELTRFILASYDTSEPKFICKDYCISQGIKYKYALQAYNNQGIYSKREETEEVDVDFEDMFLSDGKRQLKIKFNPKVTSFKNTILESKIDTLGNKYPFFFKNGNVSYKEFPISGLISMLMDDKEEFMQGIQLQGINRKSTPAINESIVNLSTHLTGDNFRREREFKIEVLNWLTNGEPKLFRSPGEGSFIVRLMNTSLSPNDILSRMLHTFSCTAYEIADYTFENLRKYGMMIEEYLETRNLNFHSVDLTNAIAGSLYNLNACMATLHASPGTKFRFKLKNDIEGYTTIYVGATGVYSFSKEVLAENPLMELCPPEESEQDGSYWLPQATLTYAVYAKYEIENFSYIHSIEIQDRIAQWIGMNRSEVDARLDKYKILNSFGLVYYLNISKRPIITSVTVTKVGSKYVFTEGDVVYHPGYNELIYYNNEYYDGYTQTKITDPIDFSFQLRYSDEKIDLKGTNISNIGSINGCDSITEVGGRLILTNVEDVDCLYVGNGLFLDIAYQEIDKTYTVETIPGHPVYMLKQIYNNSKNPKDWESYYEALKDAITKEEDLIINAI